MRMSIWTPMVCGAVLAVGLGGCAKGVVVPLHVVEGPRSTAIVVEEDDPRLQMPALRDVEVTFRRDESGQFIARSKSDDAGKLEVKVPHKEALYTEIHVIAQSEGYLPANNKVFPPRDIGKRWLIVLRPKAGYTPPPGPGAPAQR